MPARTGQRCLFLCGDVMTGRGIDQILPHPGSPLLHESCVRDAREYVRLVEKARGRFHRPVAFEYIWGDALAELARVDPALRIVNLETTITTSDDAADKEVLYRMHPRNVGCLVTAGIDCCCLANNHVLDWGQAGLVETLRTLDAAGIARAGAGFTAQEAAAPAVLEAGVGVRVWIHAWGSPGSGIPTGWAARDDRPGVNLLPDLSAETAERIARGARGSKRSGDIVIVSIHWGPNWSYDIPADQVRFAHRLVDGGVDVVHGHSSHHAKTIEKYGSGLILYGCGDFVTDYEGIGGCEEFRGDLAVMYLLTFAGPRPPAAQDADASSTGRLVESRMVVFRAQQLQLRRAPPADVEWLRERLNTCGRRFGTKVVRESDDTLIVA